VDFSGVLQAASVIVALATFAGLALQRGVVTSVREQNADYERRIVFLEAAGARDQATIAQQSADLAALQRIVTGEVQWQAISDLLDHHHKAAQEQWVRHTELLVQIRDSLGRQSP
jgi:hypothetical protein